MLGWGKMKKGLMDTDNSVVIAGGEGIRGLNGNGKNTTKNGLQSFVPQISRWMMLHSWVDQLKLIVIKSRH